MGLAVALKHWRLILTGVGLTVLLVMLALAKGEARHWQKRYQQEVKAHAQTAADYKAAQKLSEAEQRANLTRALSEQRKINETASAGLEMALADYRTRFERLRTQATRRQAGGDSMPAASSPAGQPAPADHDPGDATVAVRIDDLETLVNGALQGEAIRLWVLAQEAVETSPEAME